MWYTYTVEYYSTIKKKMLFSAACMGLEIVVINEASQIEKNKYHMISLICVQINLLKNRNRVTYVENKLMVTRL